MLEQEHEKLMLIQKLDSLKIVLLQLSEDSIVLVKPIESSNTATYLFVTLLIVCTIFLTFYCASGPIFCPIRTISQFDKAGNEILIGIKYPVDSPVSAGIRLAGSPEVVPLTRFVKTVTENPILTDSSVNGLSPVIVKNGASFMETFKGGFVTLVELFI